MAENNLNLMRFIQPIRSVVGFPTYEGAIGHVNGLIPEFSSNAKSDGVSVVARYKDGTDAEGKDIYKMLHAIYSKKDNKFTFFVHDVESLKEIEGKISSLETAIGEGGSVSQQIDNAIKELDSEKTSSNASYVNVTVKQTDGKIESVTIDETNLSNLIDKLEADETVEGSIAKAVADAKSELLGDVKEGDATTIGGLNEKIEAVEGAAKSYSIVAVTEGLSENVKEAWRLQETVGTASTLVGEAIKIYKDSSLKSVELVEEKPVEGGGSEKGQFLKFTYITSEGEDDIVYLNVSSFLVETEFKDGLQVSESGEVSVKLDGSTESFLTVGSDGIKLSGVQDAIDAVATSSSEALDKLIGKPEGGNIPVDYDTIYEIAKELEKLEGDETVEGSIASDIKKAIDEIDVSDAAVAGSYVSQVSQTDGKISVKRVA